METSVAEELDRRVTLAKLAGGLALPIKEKGFDVHGAYSSPISTLVSAPGRITRRCQGL